MDNPFISMAYPWVSIDYPWIHADPWMIMAIQVSSDPSQQITAVTALAKGKVYEVSDLIGGGNDARLD